MMNGSLDRICTLAFAAGVLCVPLDAAAGFTVTTFDRELHDAGHRTVESPFTFPDDGAPYSQVTMRYDLHCPDNGCDPWDRKGTIYIRTADDATIEIGRIITPYNKECGWSVDVTDYAHLLRGEVTLGSHIDTWVGGGTGWLVTAEFDFSEEFDLSEGGPEHRTFDVQNLWEGNPEEGHWAEYQEGRTINTEFFRDVTVDVPARTTGAKLRMNITGHGQGNKRNAGEFIIQLHSFSIGGEVIEDRWNWRDNCENNPCSPQGGTWALDRAGWCPGDAVETWDVDISDRIEPGAPLRIGYAMDDYLNPCHPSNPGCDPSRDCMWWIGTCDWNSSDHTVPHVWVESHVVLYDTDDEVPCGLEVSLDGIPETATHGDTLVALAAVRNGCDHRLFFDEATLVVSGPAGFEQTLHQGRTVPVAPDGDVSAEIVQRIPFAAPAGRYAVSVVIRRNGVAIDSQTHVLDIQ